MRLERSHGKGIDGQWIRKNETREFKEGLYGPSINKGNIDDLTAEMNKEAERVRKLLDSIDVDLPLDETEEDVKTHPLDEAQQPLDEIDAMIMKLEDDLDHLFDGAPSKYDYSASSEQKNQIVTEILSAMMNSGELSNQGIDNSSMITTKKALEEMSLEVLKEILKSYNDNVKMNNNNGISR